MLLPKRTNFFTPAQFALATAGVLGTTQKFALDRTWPIEEIILLVNITAGATGPTLVAPDSPLNIVENINLSINRKPKPYTIVDMSGVALLEFASLEGLNLDDATWEAIRYSKLATIPNNQTLRIAYRIPIVHPFITEPLRTRCLLDVHNHEQDPILSVRFAAPASLYSAGSIAAVTCEVVLLRRAITPAYNADILSKGGFIEQDILEQAFTVAVGVSGEVRVPVALPGWYANILLRSYLGGASVTRNVLDQTNTFGSESRWRLESGAQVFHEWRWKMLQVINQWSQPKNGLSNPVFAAPTSAGSPTVSMNPAPPFAIVAAGTSYVPAASCMVDFMSDGVNAANELGSLLDCNLPAQSGLKMEIIGPVASVATNGSILYVSGRRLFGDLSRWQALNA